MIESCITAFVIHFVVIDPIGNEPILLPMIGAQDRAHKMRTALDAHLLGLEQQQERQQYLKQSVGYARIPGRAPFGHATGGRCNVS